MCFKETERGTRVEVYLVRERKTERKRKTTLRNEEHGHQAASEIGGQSCVCGYVPSVYVYVSEPPVFVYVSCRVHSAEHCVQSSWRASQEARYLLLVTLLDVIIAFSAITSRKPGQEEKFTKPVYGSNSFFFIFYLLRYQIIYYDK